MIGHLDHQIDRLQGSLVRYDPLDRLYLVSVKYKWTGLSYTCSMISALEHFDSLGRCDQILNLLGGITECYIGLHTTTVVAGSAASISTATTGCLLRTVASYMGQ